jgi:hypothetical protein
LNVKTDLHPVANASSRSENLLLWRMLSSLKIMCCNNPKLRSDGGCDWVGEYGTFQAHYKVCQNKPLLDPPKATLMANANKLATVSSSSDWQYANTTAGPTPDRNSDTSSPPGEETHSDSSNTPPHPRSPTDSPERKRLGTAQTANAKPVAPKVQETTKIASTKIVQETTTKAAQDEAPKKPEFAVAVAVHAFSPAASDVDMIAVTAGDLLEVHQRHESGWAFCKSLNQPKTSSGWVPLWVLPSEEEVQPPVEEKVVAPPAPEPKVVVPEPKVVVPEPKQVVQPKETKNLVTVTTAFSATDSSQLTLVPDDRVEIVQQHTTGWTYGRKAADLSEGWFPDWACAQ